MENKHEPQSGDAALVDPLSHLTILNQAQRAPEYEDFARFGPRWYAPFLATMIVGFPVWIAQFITNLNANLEAGRGDSYQLFVIVMLSNLIVSVHAFRNRRVKAMATRIAVGLVIAQVFFILAPLVIWQLVIALVGYETFVFPWAVLAWLLSTAYFLVVRAGFDWTSNRRQAVSI